MAEMRDIHEQVLAFLLDWRARRDPGLMFTLRSRPIERLQKGYWFIGNDRYLAFSFWTGLDWLNKTQNIYVEITVDGKFSVRFSAKDSPRKSEVLSYAAEVLGGFSKSNYSGRGGNVWTKEYPGNEFLQNLQSFLEEDHPRIDKILRKEIQHGGDDAFDRAFLPLSRPRFDTSLRRINSLRSSPQPISTPFRNKEFYINRITVRNIGIFSECEMAIGKRAAVLIGENGSGKTTLLRSIALGLAGTGSPLVLADEFQLQTLPRILATGIDGHINYAGSGSINVGYQLNEQSFSNGKANQISFSLQPDTGQVIFSDRIDPEGFGLPVEENDGDGILPYLLVGYPQRYGDKASPVDMKRRSYDPNAYDILPLIMDTVDQRLESLKRWISENFNTGENNQRKVRDAFHLISSLFSIGEGREFSMEVISAPLPEKVIIRTPSNPEGIFLSLLSTGLSNLLGWVGHFISRLHEAYPKSENPLLEPAIVLIDEIDNYLHPEVQVRLMKVLLETFPKTQFILTAHSPFILASLPSAEAKAYRIEEGKAVEIEHFYGLSIDKISYDQFGIKKRPVEIQKKIDAMLRAFALGRKTEAEALLDELKPILGEDDPAILDAMLEYQT